MGSTLSLELYDNDQHVLCKVVVVRVVAAGTDEARAQITAMIARVKTGY
ncbi:MAG: hypothetical protein M3680_36835 [Myxococcota bacterium]|nr:hypothetical protein [Myxococcota bacterium]